MRLLHSLVISIFPLRLWDLDTDSGTWEKNKILRERWDATGRSSTSLTSATSQMKRSTVGFGNWLALSKNYSLQLRKGSWDGMDMSPAHQASPIQFSREQLMEQEGVEGNRGDGMICEVWALLHFKRHSKTGPSGKRLSRSHLRYPYDRPGYRTCEVKKWYLSIKKKDVISGF